MSPRVNTEDLIDAREVASILGLSQANSVSLYQRRYPDMPRPVVNLGPNRSLLWLRPQIEAWERSHPRHPGRPRSTEQPGSSDTNRPPAGGAGCRRGGRTSRKD